MRGTGTQHWLVAACFAVSFAGFGGLAWAQGSNSTEEQVAAEESSEESEGGAGEAGETGGSASGDGDAEEASDESSDAETGSEDESGEDDVDVRSELTKARRWARRNGLSRAASHYEKTLKHGAERPLPRFYNTAQLNFAKILMSLEEYERALLAFQAYLNIAAEGGGESAKQDLEKVKARVWKKRMTELSVNVAPERGSRIYIDDFLVQSGTGLEKLTLVSGEYEVRVEAPKHIPETKTIDLEMGETETLDFELRKKTFYGHAEITVDVDGATVRFEPKKLKGPKSPGAIERQSPLDEPVELMTGKWLLEVDKEDYHRWVRYVTIRKGETESVKVELDKKLPEEIR